MGTSLESDADVTPSFFRTKAQAAQRRMLEAQQRIVTLSCTLSTLVLVCNTILLIWSLQKPLGTFDTARLLYQGDCSRTATIDFCSHIGINVLSTVILVGGNYAYQILVAPTRNAIDKAHSQGRSLDIGIQSWKNWSFLERRPRFLVSVLLVTTIPLHVVYNSMIFSTTSSIKMVEAVVREDFLTLPYLYGNYETFEVDGSDLLYPIWKEVSQGNSTKFDVLTISECQSTLSVNYVHDYSAFLFVTDAPSDVEGATVLETNYNDYMNNGIARPVMYTAFWGLNEVYKVMYCLALKAEPSCTIELVPALLGIVIACNLIKIMVLFSILYLPVDRLRTIGDAIASFMESQDPFTRRLDVITTEGIAEVGQKCSPTRRYFSGASMARWVLTILFCLVCWIIGFILEEATLTTQPVSLSKQWQEGLGAFDTSLMSPVELGLIPSIILVNLPQLYLSVVYVVYNALVTSILLSKEWTGYSIERKGLRVTIPAGEQRSTYFLTIPYRFSVPLVGIMMTLHWILSQSLFLAQINFYRLSGTSLEPQHTKGDGIYAIGYSTLAIEMLLGISGILIIGVIAAGFFRYKPGMPIVRSDSRLISALCHSLDGHATKKIQYGILAELGNGRYQVGFSSGPVTPIVMGNFHK